MNKKIRFILLLVLCSSSAYSSGDTLFFKNRVLENKFHYGFLWPHHSSITYSVNGRVPAFEINWLKQTNGDKAWERFYRYPRTGFGISYFYLQDHDVFGSAYGTYGLVDIPWIRLGKITSTYRIYGGLTWMTEIWDLESNYKEIAIGSHVNLYFRIATTTRFEINTKQEIIWDVGFTHFSNGNIKRPNLGLNIVTTSLGYIHKFNAEKIDFAKTKAEKVDKKVTLYLWYAGGLKAENNVKNDYFYKSTFNIHAGYNVNKKRQFGIGTDMMYDGTTKFFREETDTLYQKASDLWQVGIIAYQDLTFNRLILTLQTGVYAINKHEYNFVYNRIGLKYKIKPDWFISVCLKSHKTQADYIEWGVGYIIL